jgi:N-acetylmuramoyl-L-alanine amidase
MKIAIDPGHGMGNARAGVFDPGATKRVGGETFAEADIVLRYGHTLKRLFEEQGNEVFMTRTSSADSAAVGRRARRATEAGSKVYVSLHLNSATSSQANGIEVLFRDEQKDRPLAERLQESLVAITGLRDRGIKRRTDLAVLRFQPGPAVLIELGFISNERDRSHVIQGTNRDAICQGIFNVLT